MDKALELAYTAHRKYLDADSKDCGPIEDYIADVIRPVLQENARLREVLESCAHECATIAAIINFARTWPTPTSEDVSVKHDRSQPAQEP